ncbi:TetR/AcrR family transcriptional regulator [Anaerorhabdus furcosa]|uniref:Transcriptional regulator, TetR family n=1 Tax=Anaerorhabdus furcosa TaxID=118967 RepID=A0A1T4K9X5_9FIRM|nr:TetR/AcrR family transcriptional regulator [Anaerorhabdus furcosa]SJZ39242.1 transcriptional regulator, TetR family [Anaerorhabdus furcosa]
MDKRKIANKQVKDKLFQALIEFANKKDWSKVSVTELIEKAGVARASFYRNFKSVEEIVDYGVQKMVEAYHQNKPENYEGAHSKELLLYKFTFYGEHAQLILTFHHAKIAHSLLDVITDCEIEEAGDMSFKSIQRYELYYFSGAFYNMMLNWLENGVKETPQQMTEEFLRIMNKEK